MEPIKRYFVNLSDKQLAQFAALYDLYSRWNSKINVISRKDVDNLYLHHVLHSLAITKVITFKNGSDILDIGTGGGFPGLPLAIMSPQSNFLLVDSVGKKLQVVEAVAKEIGLTNIRTSHLRVEDVDGKFDFAVSRAVARLDTVWGWTQNKLKTKPTNELPNGLFYLKGGDITAELPKDTDFKRWELSEFFSENYFSEKALLLLHKATLGRNY